MMALPVALTIAGSDSSGGAGIQADLKTFAALGVYGASVITALTAQNTRGVSGIHPVPADFVTAQMDAVFGDLDIKAAKLPALMSEDEDAQLGERLYLTEQLSAMVHTLVEAFITVRAGRAWSKQVVPAMKEWMRGEEGTRKQTVLQRAANVRKR